MYPNHDLAITSTRTSECRSLAQARVSGCVAQKASSRIYLRWLRQPAAATLTLAGPQPPEPEPDWTSVVNVNSC